MKLDDLTLRRLHAAGVAQQKIAAYFGLHLKTIRYKERRLMLKPRPPGRRVTPDPETVLRMKTCRT